MNLKIAEEIQSEQNRGRAKYGTGPNDLSHDDGHTQGEWLQFIADKAEILFYSTPMEYRNGLVKTAGLAVSAIESFDRKQTL